VNAVFDGGDPFEMRAQLHRMRALLDGCDAHFNHVHRRLARAMVALDDALELAKKRGATEAELLAIRNRLRL